jgi:hypothetical protein
MEYRELILELLERRDSLNCNYQNLLSEFSDAPVPETGLEEWCAENMLQLRKLNSRRLVEISRFHDAKREKQTP